jgi:hypothetical protein
VLLLCIDKRKVIMSPGVNDHPRNTGALPKSNRYTNRNRERDRSSINENSNWYQIAHRVPVQHANNLVRRITLLLINANKIIQVSYRVY